MLIYRRRSVWASAKTAWCVSVENASLSDDMVLSSAFSRTPMFTETIRIIREALDVHLDFHTAPEL